MEKKRQENNLHIIRNLEVAINKTFQEIPHNELERPFFLSDDIASIEGTCELRFHKMVSYMYKLLVERSNGNFKILADFSSSVHMSQDDILGFMETVHDFRTYFEHYLYPEDKHSKSIKDNCSLWYRAVISKNLPQNDEDWRACFERLVQDAVKCLKLTNDVLIELKENNESFIFEQWAYRQQRNIPKYKKIAVLDDIKKRYAFNYDSVVLYNKFQNRIEAAINLTDYNISLQEIDNYIYRILEKIVLSIDEFPCPVSGKEVEEKYNIRGKKLGDLMKKVIFFYKDNPSVHTKESIFAYIESII